MPLPVFVQPEPFISVFFLAKKKKNAGFLEFMFYSLNISLKLTNRLLKKSLQNMKIGIDKYMYFVYFCIVQNKQNQNEKLRHSYTAAS